MLMTKVILKKLLNMQKCEISWQKYYKTKMRYTTLLKNL